MTRVFDFLAKGGPTMILIVGLSIVTLAYTLERAVFWFRLLRHQTRIGRNVLESARYDLREAEAIAQKSQDRAIGRFLLAPLLLRSATPEAFHSALQAVADREFAVIRRGDRLFESVVGLAPLLGVFGTVVGLMAILGNLNPDGGQNIDLNQLAARVREALIPTASGLLVAIFALTVLRILVGLQTRQMNYLSRVGSELELIHRQVWYEPSQRSAIAAETHPSEELRRS